MVQRFFLELYILSQFSIKFQPSKEITKTLSMISKRFFDNHWNIIEHKICKILTTFVLNFILKIFIFSIKKLP